MLKSWPIKIPNMNQRLPGACNRSPGSKLLSITTQQSWRESATDTILQVQCVHWFQTRWFLCEFPIGSYVKLSTAVQPSWSEGGTRHLKRRLSKYALIGINRLKKNQKTPEHMLAAVQI